MHIEDLNQNTDGDDDLIEPIDTNPQDDDDADDQDFEEGKNEDTDDEPTDDDADDDQDIDDDEDADEDADDDEEDFVVVDVNGKEYEVPEGISKAIMQERDYTQSKQALAEEKKALANDKALLEAQSKRSEEDLALHSQLHMVEAQLKQYEQVNWAQLDDADPDASQRHFRDFQLLKQQKDDLTKKVSERENERTQEAQQNFAKRLEQTHDFAVKNIPNWSAELADKIEDFAVKEMGLDENFLKSNLTPSMLKLMHAAYIGNEVRNKAKRKTKRTKTNARPVKTIRSKSGERPTKRKDLTAVSMEEYAKLRKQGANPRLG